MAVTDDKGDNPIEKGAALGALMSAALALPGVADAAQGGFRSEDVKLNYHRAKYEEKGNRMSVETEHVTLTVPVGRDFEVTGSIIEDITSGASPVVNFLDIDGDPHQFVETGASIKDKRDIVEASVGYYGVDDYASFKIGRSEEDDYESSYGSLSYRLDINHKRTSISFGAGLTSDEVWNSYNPDVLLEEPSIFDRRKKKEFMVGISQIVNRNTVAQFNVTYAKSEGNLSDPYKKVYVVDEGLVDYRGLIDVAGLFRFAVDFGLVSFLNESGITRFLNESSFIDVPEVTEFLLGLKKDNRPDVREQWIYLLRFSHYMESTNSGLHFDYRYSDDSWGADSHTFDLKWNFGFESGWQISPGLRYYSQHSAFFYDVFFESLPEDEFVSSDYRLAGFGAISKKLGLSKTFNRKYTFYIDYERYDRHYDYELGGASKGSDIDDYRFKMLSFSVDAKF
ncbi:MAG: DUF3570 domain-containing protein [Pseudomonadales bacterium]|nr:DUF3570 domain-containing protein [Pseudomonadales bacterium]